MSSTLIPWRVLLSRQFNNVAQEYGPNSQKVASAFLALSKTTWGSRAGEPICDERIAVAQSWEAALTILDRGAATRDPRYSARGHLEEPCRLVEEVFDRCPERDLWWHRAREQASLYAAWDTLLGPWPEATRDRVFAYLDEYVSLLLGEIIASPDTRSTYFQKQLPWFYAGHVPCGWDGDWPQGKLRVF